jgi:hypothetical protein
MQRHKKTKSAKRSRWVRVALCLDGCARKIAKSRCRIVCIADSSIGAKNPSVRCVNIPIVGA